MRVFASFFLNGFTLDQKDLTDVWEIDVIVERLAAPNAPRFDTTVIGRREFDEVGGATILEQQRDILLQSGLVTFGSEMIMPFFFDDIGSYCALGQQGIARNIFAGNVTAFEQGDRHADFVGALLLIAALYR